MIKVTHASSEIEDDGSTALVERLLESADSFVVIQSGEQVRIVGEYLEISEEEMPFLLRQRGQWLTKVNELTFDAREIVSRMPIRIADGHVNFLAERIIFHNGGGVQFRDRPERSEQQRFQIICDILDLRELQPAFPVPLMRNATQDWNGDRWPEQGRQFELFAREILLPENADTIHRNILRDRPLRFAYNLTGDRGMAPYESWERSYSAEFKGYVYSDAVIHHSEWPRFSLRLTEEVLNAAPYDQSVRAWALSRITEMNSLKQLRNRQEERFRWRELTTRLREGTDSFGRTQYDIPSISLRDLKGMLDERVDNFFGEDGLLVAIDQAVATSLSGPTLDREAIDEVDSQITQLNDQLRSLDTNIGEVQIELQILQQSLADQASSLSGLFSSLQASFEALEKRQRDAARIKKSVQVIQLGAAIAATGGVAGAGTLMTLSGGAELLGTVATQNTLGEPITLEDLMQAYADGTRNFETHRNSIDKLVRLWEGPENNATASERNDGESDDNLGLRQIADRAYDRVLQHGFSMRDREIVAFLEKSEEAKQQVIALIQSLETTPFQQIQLNDYYAQNDELQELLGSIDETRRREGEYLEQLVILYERREECLGDLVELMIQKDALTAFVPDNPIRRARLLETSLWYRERLIAQLERQIADALRAYEYRAGQPFDRPLPSRFIETRLELPQDIEILPLDVLEERLRDNREKLRVSFATIVGLLPQGPVRTTIPDFQQELYEIPSDVLALLNKSLQDQVRSNEGENSWVFPTVSSAAFSFRPRHQSTGPVRVLSVRVDNISFTHSPNWNIRFVIQHQGTGLYAPTNPSDLRRVNIRNERNDLVFRTWNTHWIDGALQPPANEAIFDRDPWEFTHPITGLYTIKAERFDHGDPYFEDEAPEISNLVLRFVFK
ncbi:MAG: hypothetical protein ACFB21_04580 [Opitutales bacterium]